jgi:hypothetical protein
MVRGVHPGGAGRPPRSSCVAAVRYAPSVLRTLWRPASRTAFGVASLRRSGYGCSLRGGKTRPTGNRPASTPAGWRPVSGYVHRHRARSRRLHHRPGDRPTVAVTGRRVSRSRGGVSHRDVVRRRDMTSCRGADRSRATARSRVEGGRPLVANPRSYRRRSARPPLPRRRTTPRRSSSSGEYYPGRARDSHPDPWSPADPRSHVPRRSRTDDGATPRYGAPSFLDRRGRATPAG